jgi:hypothetical protein
MSDRPKLNDDFRDMLDSLNGASVEYLIVGAYAMAAHGVPRATGDIDILVRPTPENARRVIAALRSFGAPLAQHHVSERDFEVEGAVYQLGLPPRRIDLLTSISGVSFADAWTTRVPATVDGRELAVLGRDTLIANKRATGRPKDLLDVQLLEQQR